MKTIKLTLPLLALFLVLAFFSCNSNSQTTTTDTTATDTTTAVTESAPATFIPFDVMIIEHTVKDYAKWRPAYNIDSVNRNASGLKEITVGTDISKPNDVLIVLNASDVQKAKDFAADPRLKDVMAKAGVISKPDISFWHVIRYNPDSHEKQWVEVTHKVKDFSAWVKVYDAEGKEKRESEGMTDVALAHGIDDPNMVKIVFDVTDMKKAKAAITSDAKKKIMMDAGLIGTPKIVFYQTAE